MRLLLPFLAASSILVSVVPLSAEDAGPIATGDVTRKNQYGVFIEGAVDENGVVFRGEYFLFGMSDLKALAQDDKIRYTVERVGNYHDGETHIIRAYKVRKN